MAVRVIAGNNEGSPAPRPTSRLTSDQRPRVPPEDQRRDGRTIAVNKEKSASSRSGRAASKSVTPRRIACRHRFPGRTKAVVVSSGPGQVQAEPDDGLLRLAVPSATSFGPHGRRDIDAQRARRSPACSRCLKTRPREGRVVPPESRKGRAAEERALHVACGLRGRQLAHSLSPLSPRDNATRETTCRLYRRRSWATITLSFRRPASVAALLASIARRHARRGGLRAQREEPTAQPGRPRIWAPVEKWQGVSRDGESARPTSPEKKTPPSTPGSGRACSCCG